ncbi:AcrR family transcriptional regulator [Leucobacter exalbidus]|uniref:AcrR family transcriptional regulator n=1 Tax=Leucobacter exalbidus TaxID=662960 RepID=A0A940T0K7_9MICO|nr:TetR/AcrR family transcriptional regulator [Leucobacter exalbidus]MBP1325995.1 AcrR family transcriptional regulator [Leucobacter exalbidus]
MAKKQTHDRNDPGSDRRQQILAIAAKLFASQGYSSTTVRDIADEAGILSGSLYHHFASKEAIAQEILRNFFAGMTAKYDAILAAQDDASTTFENLVTASFEIIADQPDAVGLYQNEALFLQTQSGFEFLRETSLRVEGMWIEQLKRGQEAGVFRETFDPAALHRFIRDALWSTVRWYRPGGKHTVESLTATFLDLVRHGVLVD